VRLYIRFDPKMAEEKLAAGYTLAQVGALAMLHGQGEQQPERGRFKSMALLVASMDCMVEEHGPKTRTSQHIPFLMERGDIVKLEGGGYYIDGWDELQEGDHSPQARMELVRGRKGRPGNPGSPGARRQREYRARQSSGNGVAQPDGESVTNTVTNPISDASQGVALCDADMASDSDASPVPRAKHKQEQKAVAVAVAVVTRHNPDVTNGLSTELPDVQAYGERFIHHGRAPSAENLEYLRSLPFLYDRLSVDVVLSAIDDVAAKFLAQGKPMPKAKYLAGRLGDLQAAASDRGVRPRMAGVSSQVITRLGDLLPRVLQ